MVLDSQADLSGLPATTGQAGRDARAAEVYRRLVAHADESQADLRRELDRFRLSYTPYYLVNAIEVEGGAGVRALAVPSRRRRPGPAQPAAAAAARSRRRADPRRRYRADASTVEHRDGRRGPGLGRSGTTGAGHRRRHLGLRCGRYASRAARRLPRRRRLVVRPVDRHPHARPTRAATARTRWARPSGATTSASLRARSGSAASTSTATWATRRTTSTACSSCSPRSRPAATRSPTADPARAPHVLTNSWGCPPIEGCDLRSLDRPSTRSTPPGLFFVAAAGNTGDLLRVDRRPAGAVRRRRTPWARSTSGGG